ncbi:hypothetical protein B0H16DRAFT_1708240 [Mycena metata]|uniref:Protein kinase domain-containing protein n=1 Tax=Mycena metata TaxID=1033252 RepID=A0AAD7KHR3_9AGAR|nr:hypothetical protein B0H16DRAFT_1708240 [Mycena metata]
MSISLAVYFLEQTPETPDLDLLFVLDDLDLDTRRVSHLLTAVKKQLPSETATTLRLLEAVAPFLVANNHDSIRQRAIAWAQNNSTAVLPTTLLSEACKMGVRNPKHIFIVVEEAYRQDLVKIAQFSVSEGQEASVLERLRQLRTFPKSPPPSTAVHDPSAIKLAHLGTDKNTDTAIRAGRPANNRGPSVSLFSEPLAVLSEQISTPDSLPRLSHSFLVDVEKFMRLATQFYATEDARIAAYTPFLNTLLGEGQWESKANRAKPDARWKARVIAEMKNEPGLSGDPRLQAEVSYRYVISSAEDGQTYGLSSNCPSVLLGISTQLSVSIAVMTDCVYVDNLFLGDLVPSADLDASVIKIARVFQAVKMAAITLQQTYQPLPSPVPFTPLVFPHPVTRSKQVLPKLDFIGKISRSGRIVQPHFQDAATRPCALYAATLPDGTKVAVKFTKRYGIDAHKLLAELSFAPILHGVFQVQDGYLMVVMELVEGVMAWGNEAQISTGAVADLCKAVQVLHAQGLVHGDLRLPNIMLLAGQQPSIKILDFDWAGLNTVTSYPACISNDLDLWGPRVQRHGAMAKEDDEFLLDKFRQECNAG